MNVLKFENRISLSNYLFRLVYMNHFKKTCLTFDHLLIFDGSNRLSKLYLVDLVIAVVFSMITTQEHSVLKCKRDLCSQLSTVIRAIFVSFNLLNLHSLLHKIQTICNTASEFSQLNKVYFKIFHTFLFFFRYETSIFDVPLHALSLHNRPNYYACMHKSSASHHVLKISPQYR